MIPECREAATCATKKLSPFCSDLGQGLLRSYFSSLPPAIVTGQWKATMYFIAENQSISKKNSSARFCQIWRILKQSLHQFSCSREITGPPVSPQGKCRCTVRATSPSIRASRRACQVLTAPAVMPGRIWHHHPPRTTSSSSSPPHSDCPIWALNYSPRSHLSPPLPTPQPPETPTFYFSIGIHQSKHISTSCEGWQTHWGEFPRAPLHLQHT